MVDEKGADRTNDSPHSTSPLGHRTKFVFQIISRILSKGLPQNKKMNMHLRTHHKIDNAHYPRSSALHSEQKRGEVQLSFYDMFTT
jgi:hypothetical protein